MKNEEMISSFVIPEGWDDLICSRIGQSVG